MRRPSFQALFRDRDKHCATASLMKGPSFKVDVYLIFDFIHLIILSILFLMLTITKKILFSIQSSNKMLIDVSTLVKKAIEHKTGEHNIIVTEML